VKTANFPRSYIEGTYGTVPFEPTGDDWLISISDAYDAVPQKAFGRVFFFNFMDVEDETHLMAFTDEQAAEMANIIRYAKSMGKNLYVNCHAGICRSGAVVRVLSLLGWELNAYPGRPFVRPNMLVFHRLRRQFPELSQSWDV
jgi:protein-tyrosine phosphatase